MKVKIIPVIAILFFAACSNFADMHDNPGFGYTEANPLYNAETILHADDAMRMDNLGNVVLFNGNEIIAAASGQRGVYYSDDCAGCLYVFGEDADGSWRTKQTIYASDGLWNHFFGSSVAADSGVMIVGAPYRWINDESNIPGCVYFFEKNASGNWLQKQKLFASDRAHYDQFGYSVAVKGSIAAVGAPFEDGASSNASDCGAVYVFEKADGVWSQKAILHASDFESGDHFGFSLFVENNEILIGAPGEDGPSGSVAADGGAAYLYGKDASGKWIEKQEIRANDRQAGDQFGYCISCEDSSAVIGAPYEDGGSSNTVVDTGVVYVYNRTEAGLWEEDDVLYASYPQKEDFFGCSAAIAGNLIAVGSNGEDGGVGSNVPDSGCVYVYERKVTEWNFIKRIHASDKQKSDKFGTSVAVSEDAVVVGSLQEDGGADSPLADSGAVYVYKRDEAADL